jgi:hypothetical protein
VIRGFLWGVVAFRLPWLEGGDSCDDQVVEEMGNKRLFDRNHKDESFGQNDCINANCQSLRKHQPKSEVEKEIG